MQHYTGNPLPDKCFHEQWLETAVKNLCSSIDHAMQDLGMTYEAAKIHTKPSTTAGSKVWEIVDAKYKV